MSNLTFAVLAPVPLWTKAFVIGVLNKNDSFGSAVTVIHAQAIVEAWPTLAWIENCRRNKAVADKYRIQNIQNTPV